MKITYKTIARIRVRLSDYSDKFPDFKSNVWINLIGGFKGKSELPFRTMVRVNVKLSDGTLMKGPLRKFDFEKFIKVSELFYTRANNNSSSIEILMPDLIEFKKLQRKKEEAKDQAKNKKK